MFDAEVVKNAAVPDALRPAGVYGLGLGVQDAEFLVELLRYLTGELDKVAAVQFAVRPVKPGKLEEE